MSKFEYYQLIFILAAFISQVWALWLCYEHIQFAKKYSKLWAWAFVVFFATMLVTFTRRITILGDLLDIWGSWSPIINSWIDHIVIPTANSIGWVAFLYVLRKWWTSFFDKYFDGHADLKVREDAVKIREDAVEKKERDLLIMEPNGVHVEEPEKVIVELGDKKVHLDRPKKVIVLNPKEVIEEVKKGE